MIAIALALATPGFILFGWLSDKIGRKPIMMAGFLLAVVTYFPLFQGAHALRQPGAREGAGGLAGDGRRRSERVLVPAQADRHREFTTPCDVAKSALVARSVNYNNETAAPGAPVVVKVGEQTAHRPARRTS